MLDFIRIQAKIGFNLLVIPTHIPLTWKGHSWSWYMQTHSFFSLFIFRQNDSLVYGHWKIVVITKRETERITNCSGKNFWLMTYWVRETETSYQTDLNPLFTATVLPGPADYAIKVQTANNPGNHQDWRINMSKSSLILLSWRGKAVRGKIRRDSNATHSSNQIFI